VGNTLKSHITRFLRRLGFDVRLYRPASSESAQLVKMLSAHRINLVFDVGANAGHFGQFLRDASYRGRIVSFEPLSTAWKELLKASRKDHLWEVAPRAAIGSDEGELEIHVARNSVSSSILAMHAAHTDAAPESGYIGKERVSLRRLDSLASEYLRSDSVPFLKIDTQGYEDHVLNGADGIIDRIVGIQLELSLVPLYKGQRLFDDFTEWLKRLGFELWAMSPVLVDPQSGRLLQLDATFFRCPIKKNAHK
jgi:FkbM family methyltransferase